MSEHDDHSSFIKTPKQLAVVILLAFLVPVLGIVMVVELVTGGLHGSQKAMTPQATAERIAPVGQVAFAGKTPAEAPAPQAVAAPASAPASTAASAHPADVGKHIYSTVCFACHATGAAGAPKFGDKAAWAPRIALGVDALVKVALHGKGAMPPKGGNASLSDADLRAAVVYMVSHAK